MLNLLVHKLQAECSGLAACQAVADLSRYHRIQASPGFRQAAGYICEQLAKADVEGNVISFPANTATAFWGASSFQEWNANAGTLHLIEPQDEACKLADFREVPLSLIPRSVSFDGEADLVAVDRGEEPEDYAGLDVAGKVVLTRGNVRRVHDLAVRRRGALGIIYDGMAEIEPVRPFWSLPDAIEYASFWWYGDEPKCFGFALSPREGERVRRLVRKGVEREKQPVRVRALVDAQLYNGTLDLVNAIIPGTSAEEIVLVGHLCHPQPSSNDNASACAAMLEGARALQALIASGELAQPLRTLRFLWVPEMTGSYAFLAANESKIPHMVAGLNLDMVGQDQEQCGSTLLLQCPPDALSSFAPDLLSRIREMIFPESNLFCEGPDDIGPFRHALTPFRSGSDDYIFSDPTVGVPMPVISQWPDRYYHTTADTPDRVDPALLGKISVLAAAYAYWLGQADQPDALWLASEMSARFRQRILVTVQRAVTDAPQQSDSSGAPLYHRLQYQMDRHREALASLRRLAPLAVSRWQNDDAAFVEAEFTRSRDLLPPQSDDTERQEVNTEASHLIPRRKFRGPLWIEAHVGALDAAGRDEWWRLGSQIGEEAPIQYWVDGRRTIREIGYLDALQRGQEVSPLLLEYFRFLERLGLVDLEYRR